MAFDANAGRILVTNASGQTRLDTDEALFHIVDTITYKLKCGLFT